MAIQILNLSTDAIDFQPFHTTNLYEFNDLNTIAEYFAEIVLKHENAFPEYQKGSSSSKSQLEKHINIKLYFPYTYVLLNKKIEPINSHSPAISDTYSYLFYRDINPPPKA